MTELLQEIVSLLVSGISQIATGIGSGLSSLVQNIFVVVGDNGATSLSTFGGVVIIFGGVALAIGLSRFVVNWISSWGN